MIDIILYCSNWANIYARSCEPELVHDIVDSEEDQCYDDEDDSNGNENYQLRLHCRPSVSLLVVKFRLGDGSLH